MNDYVAHTMSPLWMWVFGIGFISTAIFLLLFAHRVRLIERKIKQKGRDGLRPLDLGGSKIVTYAYVIVFPEHIALRLERLIDANIVRGYATKTDWITGLLFIATSHCWIISTILYFYLR